MSHCPPHPDAKWVYLANTTNRLASSISIPITSSFVQCFSSPEKSGHPRRARYVGREGTLTGFHIPCHVWRAYSEHTWTRGPRAAVYSPLDILQHRKQLLQLPTAQQLSHPAAVTTNGQDPFVIKRALNERLDTVNTVRTASKRMSIALSASCSRGHGKASKRTRQGPPRRWRRMRRPTASSGC